MIEVRKIDLNQKELVEVFLHNAGDSLKSFRYFSKRPIDALKQHLVTILLLENNIPVGYGHLDLDGSDIWLGIAIIEGSIGKGYGKILMNTLLIEADQLKLNKVKLSVDKGNNKAIALYEKYGFVFLKEKGEVLFYEYKRK